MRLRETKRGARVSRGRASGVDGRGRAVRDGECSCRGAKRVAARRDPEGASTGNAPGDGRQGCRLFVHGVRKTVRRRTCGRAMGTRSGASDEAGCERRETRRALRACDVRGCARRALREFEIAAQTRYFLNATAFKRCESSAGRDATSQRRVVRLDSRDRWDGNSNFRPPRTPNPHSKENFAERFRAVNGQLFPPGAASIDALSPRVTEGSLQRRTSPLSAAASARSDSVMPPKKKKAAKRSRRPAAATSAPGPTSRRRRRTTARCGTSSWRSAFRASLFVVPAFPAARYPPVPV